MIRDFIQARYKNLFLALAVSGALLLLIGFSIGPIRTFINNNVSLHVSNDWQGILKIESQDLAKQTDSLAHSDLIALYIKRNDLTSLLAYSVDETTRRNIDSILVINNDGLVLSRSFNANRRGDYIGETTSWAPEVIQGKMFSSVESGPTSMFLIAGQPIVSDGKIIGGVFSVKIMNDAYSRRIKDTYLPAGSEVAFVASQVGLVGDSFSSKNYSQFAQAYLNDINDKGGISSPGKISEIKIGKDYYLTKAISLEGLSGGAGSIVIFTPDQVANNVILLAMLVALSFFLVEVLTHRNFKKRNKTGHHIRELFLFNIIIFFIALFLFWFLWLKPSIRISKPLYTIYNSTIALKPDNAIVQEGFEQTVAIQVTSGGEYINAGEAGIYYDPQKVSVEEIITDHSFCDNNLFVQKSIDPIAGKVTIICGLASPGFSGIGILAELVLKPLKPGGFTLSFSDDTTILANDGLATNVLRAKTDGGYEVISPNFSTSGPDILVYSPTHPNVTRWYDSPNVFFVWSAKPGDEFRYVVNDSPEYKFSGDEPLVSGNSLNLSVPGDGSHYFHIERVGGGATVATGSYLVKIDTTPPEHPVLKISNSTPEKGEVVRFEFSSPDSSGNIRPSYYIKIDDGLFLPVGQRLSIPFIESGKHKIVVRVFDKANNFSETSAEVNVQ